MPLSFVGFDTSTSTASPSIAATGAQPGDLLIAKGFDNSVTPPTSPGGIWLDIGTAFRTGAAQRCVYRVYQAGDADPVWAGVTSNSLYTYRGQHASTPIGGWAPSSGSGLVITLPTVSMVVADGTSWITGLYGHRNATGFDTPPGMFERFDVPDGVIRQAASDTNGGVSSFASRTYNAAGTAAAWVSMAIEIKAAVEEAASSDKFFQFI